MANTKSAAKRSRQAPVRTARNKAVKTGLKNRLKEFKAAVAAGKAEDIKQKAQAVVSAYDKAAKSGVIHQNKADRHKGSINRAVVGVK